jgi:hypothetical protein
MARKPDTLCAGGCGKLIFTSHSSLPPGVATCQACRRERRAAAQATKPPRPRHPNARKGRICEACGAIYDATYSAQRTCGRACGLEIRVYPEPKEPIWPSCKVWIKACAVCGELSTFRTKRKIWTCSRRCKDREYDARCRPAKNSGPAPCLTCQQGSFPFPRRNCQACTRQIKRTRKRRRDALKRGAATEAYTLAEVAQRDRYRCGLCGKRVAMTKAVPHPKSPTIDHVLPLARGGDDTRANVQLAHFICNSTKCVGGTQQLALIG